MVNRYYQKHKERLQIKARERYQNLSEKKKIKGEKRLKKDIKILLKKKKTKIHQYYLERKKKLSGYRRNY